MTRISILTHDDMTDEQRRVYDDAAAAGKPHGGPYWAYIRIPELMRASHGLSETLRSTDLSARELQIAILTVIRHWGAKYPWAVQVRASQQAGVPDAVIDAINQGRAPTFDGPREELAHLVAKELVGDRGISDATYKKAAAAFNEAELVALVGMVGQFCSVSLTANAFDIDPPADAPARLA